MLFYLTVTLWVSASLANESQHLENNPFPCMPSTKTNGYNDFLYKHVRSDAPTTLDQNRWQDFIRQIKTCNRPVQSFLPYSDKQRVDSVCSPAGGKVYSDNLCVSEQEFTFTTVHVDNNCIVTRVLPEKKYLILACDEVQGQCHPVHFQANRNNTGPDPNSPACKNPKLGNHAGSAHPAHPAHGLLTLTLLLSALTPFI